MSHGRSLAYRWHFDSCGLERGYSAQAMDRLLGSRTAMFHAWELGWEEPRLGDLEKVLGVLEVDLQTLDRTMRNVAGIPWPARERLPRRSREECLLTRRVLVSLDRLGPPIEAVAGSFAEALVWLRRFFELSQEELAHLVRRTPRTIRALEAGLRRPSSETQSEIAGWLKPHFDQRLAAAGHLGIRSLLGWRPFRSTRPSSVEYGATEKVAG